MYQVKFENANSLVEAAVNGLLPDLNNIVANGAAPKFSEDLRSRWFKDQANSQQVLDNLKKMDTYLNKTCQVLTFVVKDVDHRVDSAKVEKGDYAQVINTDYVSSGTRIFILPSFASQVPEEKLNTVIHELSHRIFGTTDAPGGTLVYGRDAALNLSGANAVICAENWGYFYMELGQKLGVVKGKSAAGA